MCVIALKWACDLWQLCDPCIQLCMYNELCVSSVKWMMGTVVRGDVQQYVVQESMGWAGDLWWWVNGRPRNWIRDISRERLLLFSMEEKKVINQGSRLILPTGRTFATNFLRRIARAHNLVAFFFIQHLIDQCMLINFYHSLWLYGNESVKHSLSFFSWHSLFVFHHSATLQNVCLLWRNYMHIS